MAKLSVMFRNADGTMPPNMEADFARLDKVDISLSYEELKKCQSWGSMHIATIDVEKDGATQRFMIEIGAPDRHSDVQCRVTAMHGKTETKERVTDWIRAGWIDFKARLKARLDKVV